MIPAAPPAGSASPKGTRMSEVLILEFDGFGAEHV